MTKHKLKTFEEFKKSQSLNNSINLFKTKHIIEKDVLNEKKVKNTKESIELIIEEYKPKISELEKHCYYTSKLSALLKTIDKTEFVKIHKDKKVAIELIKWFVSMFPTSHLINMYKDNKYKKYTREKSLYYDYLILTFGKQYYNKIKMFCINHNIIEIVKNYSIDCNLSTVYQLTDYYFYSKDVRYTFKTKPVIKRYIAKELNKMRESLLSTETTEMYIQELKNRFSENIHIPTIEEVRAKLEDYAEKEKTDTKGRLVITLNKYYEIINTKSNITKEEKILNYAKRQGVEKVVVVEVLLDHFVRTIELLPVVSRHGSRITTNVNLQTGLVREMITINKQEELVGLDFKALHINIAIGYFGTIREQNKINGDVHTKFAEKCNITRAKSKLEGLSFLNRNIFDMRSRKEMFKCFEQEIPLTLKNITDFKYATLYNKNAMYKFLTYIEMKIMSKVLQLAKYQIDDDIVILNVYDELIVPQKYKNEIKDIMNIVAQEYNVKTYVE